MGKNMKEGLLKVKNTVKVFTHGKKVTDMKDSLPLISVKDWENITGVMVDFTQVNGRLIE